LDCLYGNDKEEITELKTHNGWNRERDVKERYDNFIQIIRREHSKKKGQKQLRKWGIRKNRK
jgi:hypothetical protein